MCTTSLNQNYALRVVGCILTLLLNKRLMNDTHCRFCVGWVSEVGFILLHALKWCAMFKSPMGGALFTWVHLKYIIWTETF